MIIWWWFDDDFYLIRSHPLWKTFGQIYIHHTQIHIFIIWILFIFITHIYPFYNSEGCSILCSCAGEIFSSPRIAWKEEFEAEIQIHGIYILPFTQELAWWMEEIHQSENWEIFFLLKEIFTTHFLCQTPSEQMGRGVPSDLVGIWEIILWFLAPEFNCILMAS